MTTAISIEVPKELTTEEIEQAVRARVAANLKRLLDEKGSGNKLRTSTRASRSRNCVKDILRGETSPRIDTLAHLAVALDVDISEFFAKPVVTGVTTS